MNWVITSLLMFVFSIIYYLFIKKAQINKIDNKLYMIFNFTIPTLLFLSINIIQNKNIFLNGKLILFMFLNALFFSYLGSVVSYIAIGKAPNAGYSLVIQKSHAMYTSIASVFIFGSELTLLKFIAILIIIISTLFLSIDKKLRLNLKNYSWVIYSILAFLLFGTLRLNNKIIVNQGVPAITLLFWTTFFVSIISLFNFIRDKKSIKTKLSLNNLLIVFAIGISVTFFYYFLQISELASPNIGYVGAINTASNAFYTILVALIFKDHLSLKKLFAVIGVTAGLILLII